VGTYLSHSVDTAAKRRLSQNKTIHLY